VYDEYKRVAEDNSLEEKDSLGHLSKRVMTNDEIQNNGRYESRTADLRNFDDGDSTSNFVYNYGNTTLVNDDSKVIKGASWADRAYWMSPGTRRFMQANTASSTVGFRCVMDRLGSPNGSNKEGGGNHFGKDKKFKH
jgi:hypothetical protein